MRIPRAFPAHCFWLACLVAPSLAAVDGAREPSRQAATRVPNPFAPNPPLASLEHARSLRPQTLPAAPLAGWEADRIIRTAAETNCSDAEVRKRLGGLGPALQKFRQVAGFFLRKDEEGIWISNGDVGLEFLPERSGMALTSFYDLTTGTDALYRRVKRGVPWRLVFLTQGDPARSPRENYGDLDIFHTGTKVVGNALARFVTTGEPVFKTASASFTFQRETVRLTLRWEGVTVPDLQGDFDVTLFVTLKKHSPLVLFRAGVRNRVTNAGLVQVFAPWVRNFGYPHECSTSWSWGCGRGYRFIRDRGSWRGDYPSSRWSMQFLSVGMGPMTMYLANHDPRCRTKQFFLQCGRFFGFGQYVENTGIPGNQYEQEFDVALGPVRGTWYDAAKRYRKWASTQPWCSRGPLRFRAEGIRKAAEVACWIRPGYRIVNELELSYRTPGEIARFRRYEKEREVEMNVRFLGPDRLGIRWYTWYRELFDDHLPDFTPFPEMGEVFARERNRGLVVLPYTQCEVWDTTLKSYAKVKPWRAKRLGGGFLYERYCTHGPVTWTCPVSPVKLRRQVELARLLKSLHASGMYLDSFTARTVDCYDKAHGHPLGIGGWWYVEAQKRILAAIEDAAGRDFVLVPEYFVESYLDYFSLSLSSIWVEPEEVPLVPAVYSGYTQQLGSRGEADDDPVSFRLRTGRILLWGGQLGTWMFSYYLDRAPMRRFMKRCVDLRRALTKYLAYGELLKPPVWRSDMPTVLTTHWKTQNRRQDGKVFDAVEATVFKPPGSNDPSRLLLMVNYDDKPHRVRLGLNDLVARGKQVSVYRIQDDKREEVAAGMSARDELTLDAPAAAPVGYVFQEQP